MIEIQLTQGQVTVVDDEDADLADLKWLAVFNKTYSGGGRFVVIRHVIHDGKVETYLLHRVVLSRMLGRKLARHEHTDHITRDTLDNRRSNLRLANNSQNNANRAKPKNNKSGYKGVTFQKDKGKWRARIYKDKRGYHLGYYNTEAEAHQAYCEKAKELFGEFARFE